LKNMRITEGQLRRIIRESIIQEDSRKRAEMMAGVEARVNHPELPRGSDAFDYDFNNYRKRREGGRSKSERELKKIWNENADHHFFDKGIVKFHEIGMYAVLPGEATERCLSFLEEHDGATNRDDISVMGRRIGAPETKLIAGARTPFGVFVDGRVTYAGAGDMATEWTSQASPVTRKLHASSGLPKRPFYTRREDVESNIVLDEEDWIERIERSGKHFSHELIVSNWRIKSLFIGSKSWAGEAMLDRSPTVSRSKLETIIRFCKSYNLPIVNEMGDRYEII